MWGIVLGTLVAITLRVLLTTGVVTQLMTIPYVKLVGGVLLFWIAVKLLGGEENGREGTHRSRRQFVEGDQDRRHRRRSDEFDNIIAVAAASRGSYALPTFGLAVSIPLIMAGAAIVIALLERFPVIVWAGAGLSRIAGEIIAGYPLFTQHFDAATAHTVKLAAATGGAALVLFIGMVRRRLTRRRRADDRV